MSTEGVGSSKANDDLSHFDAKRIVRAYIDEGGTLAEFLSDAPDGLTKVERDIYAATKIWRAAQ